MYEAIYPDPASPERIPIVIVIDNAASDDYCDGLGTAKWKPDNDLRPVIMLRASEARALSGQMLVALAKLEEREK